MVNYDGDTLHNLQCMLPKRHFRKPLFVVLYWAIKSMPNPPRLAAETIKIVADGFKTDGKAEAISFVKSALIPVRVLLTLPYRPNDGKVTSAAEAVAQLERDAEAKKAGTDKHKPTFVVDVQTEDGETVYSLGSELEPKYLSLPLSKAILKASIAEFMKQLCIPSNAHPPSGITPLQVIVNGHAVDAESKAKCSTYLLPGSHLVSVVLVIAKAHLESRPALAQVIVKT